MSIKSSRSNGSNFVDVFGLRELLVVRSSFAVVLGAFVALGKTVVPLLKRFGTGNFILGFFVACVTEFSIVVVFRANGID